MDLSPVNIEPDPVLSFQDLRSSYSAVRKRTADICRPLKTEDYVVQPAIFVSPAKWHLGHTSWFFESFILEKHLPNYEVFHHAYAFVFNSYYNTMGSRVLRADRGNLSRPTTDEVYEYRDHVDRGMKQLLDSVDYSHEIANLVTIGLNHEQQHQELLLTDIKYILGSNPLLPPYDQTTSLIGQSNTEYGFAVVAEGLHSIGATGNGFAYDNEFAAHQVFLPEFQIDKALVTNGEFIEFMEAGGYENSNYWLDEGWTWVKETGCKAPIYWCKEGNQWFHYTLNGYQAVRPNDQLAHVSFYEAAAYAEWKGMRLPTEFEWEAAANLLNWGTRWEWTNSAYLAYPGYSKPEGAVGEYNGKFMMNQMVLRGASTATAEGHSRITYRNFFHPDLRWQVTGIRLVKK